MEVVDVRLIKLEVLAQYVGTDPVLQRRVSQKFLESVRETVVEMMSAAAAMDYARIERLAHRLKPSLLAMGARPIGELVEQLEAAADAGNAETVDEYLGNFEPMLAQLEQEIAAMS